MTEDQQREGGGQDGRRTFDGVQAPTQRRVSRILFWYIAREFALPLVCCLLAFVALFLVRDMFDALSDVLNSETSSLGQLLVYFVIQLPVNLPYVLPMSILLSASFMVHSLQRHHEIAAMRASGLSLLVCSRPVWILGLVLSLASFWVGEALAPGCAAAAERMRDSWTETEAYKERHAHLSFSNTEDRRDWYFSRFRPGGRHQGVLVKQFRPDNTTEWELRAREAQYLDGEWVFYKATMAQFDDQGRMPRGALQQVDRLTLSELRETPTRIVNQLRKVEELSVRKMREILRVNPAMADRQRGRIHTTIWFRFAYPFACLVGALLGTSLSICRERGGGLRGFAMAIGLMGLYYVSSQIALVLGQQGYLPPFVGGGLPTLLFLGLGSWQMYSKR